MSAFNLIRNGDYTTAVCKSPRCTVSLVWRGTPDNPPPSARNGMRGHVCQPRGRK